MRGRLGWAVLVGWIGLSWSGRAWADQVERTAREPERPNVVFILADDMGFGDVHALNPSSRIPTPSLDRLAAEGLTFGDAHSPSAVCTPTRYGVLTGRYAWRTRLKSGVLNGYGAPLMERDRPNVATVLRSAGYDTAIVGKWHLGLGLVRDGDAWQFDQAVTDGPNDHGFVSSFIIPASLDFPPYLYFRDGAPTTTVRVDQPAARFPGFLRKGPRGDDLIMEECLDRLVDEAVGYLTRRAEQPAPFFLYLPLTAPHKPVSPHPRYQGTTSLGPYGDFVAQVDGCVGTVLAALDQLGLADDTLVVYTSDNGSFMHSRTEEKDHVQDPSVQAFHPDHHRANHHWRGTKADIWEAGHRVPCLVRWPAQVQAGTRCDATICLTDWFATCAELAGAPLPQGASPDGYSLAAHLRGRQAPSRPPVIHHSVNGTFALREGPWKLVLSDGSGGREAPKGKPFGRPYRLFHLGWDPGERHDLREAFPSIATRLETLCEAERQRDV